MCAMPRFQLGQKVVITGPIATKHRGHKGTIVQVSTSRYARPGMTSLDKYVVRFVDESEVQFFDIQLMAAPLEKRDA